MPDTAKAPGGKPAPAADDTKRSPGAQLDHERNTGLRTGGATPAAAAEYGRIGVNPRLDNRVGDQRPPAAEWPAKPQHVDGPEVGHFAEHAERHGGEAVVDDRERLGMKAEGPHGLGPHGVTVGDAHGRPLAAEAGAGDGDPRNPAS